MKDVGPILVDKDPVLVVVVVRVSADVWTSIADEDLLVPVSRESLRHRGAGESRSYDQVIEHDTSGLLGDCAG